MKLACIIVTKDRPQELARCLASLKLQTQPAEQVIVVDANTTGVVGITKQRNYGRAQVLSDIDIVVYCDDDVELAPDAFAQTRAMFIEHPDAVGVTGLMHEPYSSNRFKRNIGHYTMLYTPEPYGLTCGMFNSINPFTGVIEAAWLPGAYMAYRWAVVKNVPFDEWFSAYGLGEDLDFSLAVKRLGKLVANSAIHIQHHHSNIGRNWKQFGYMRIHNRAYLLKKYFAKSWRHQVSYYWANLWLVFLNILRSPVSSRHRQELMGEFKALLHL